MDNGGERKISIKEIASLAGVSVATVSRVINQSGYVARETETRVREVVKRYGYVPNLMARGLRTNRSPIVGVVIPDITNEFFANIVLCIQTRLFKSHYSTMICNTNESAALERAYLSTLSAQSISWLIFISGQPASGCAPSNVPTIYVDRRPYERDAEDAVTIESDNEEGGYLAVRELLGKGCRRIAIITDLRGISSHLARYNGYLRALEEAGVDGQERGLLQQVEVISFSDARRLTSRMIKRRVPFDGIFCTTDQMALGAITALQQHGVSVPETVKVIGFDDISIARYCQLPFTTIRQPTHELGLRAVDTLLKMIAGETIENRKVMLPVQLVRRLST